MRQKVFPGGRVWGVGCGVWGFTHFTSNIQESQFFQTINVICSQQRYNKNSTFLDKNREESFNFFLFFP
ncbi:hypothetical protein B1L04_24035 [Microcystis aeruginosa KW]|uniref:Type IV pilin PilA n=1 Tax=Microcystis aeruginosa KW TaxID=1960155 RepID=A0A1V4BNN2_MICAE|nr:hypothetical protein [Microcystis aeruginosa]OPF15553.1 hypothetical protein B1L04_24035 [Microcystis aeruginosa KW]